MLATMGKTFVAVCVSIPLGVALGITIRTAVLWRGLLSGILDFLRSIPIVALVPLFIMIVGIDAGSAVAAAVFASTPLMALSTLTGLQSGSVTRHHVIALSEMPRWSRWLYVHIPEMLPQLLLGVRASVSAALVGVVVMEMMVSSGAGIGMTIQTLRYSDDLGTLYAAIVWLGFFGYSMNMFLIWVERRTLHWSGR